MLGTKSYRVCMIQFEKILGVTFNPDPGEGKIDQNGTSGPSFSSLWLAFR